MIVSLQAGKHQNACLLRQLTEVNAQMFPNSTLAPVTLKRISDFNGIQILFLKADENFNKILTILNNLPLNTFRRGHAERWLSVSFVAILNKIAARKSN